MTTKPQITMLRVGDRMPGYPGERAFSQADLESIAAAYDKSIDQAPLVIGEPQLDDPAYGWIDGLTVVDGKLIASVSHVEPGFAEQVRQGLYTRVQSSLYLPNNPNNPKPGSWYPRHISFEGIRHTIKDVLNAIALKARAARRTASFGEGSEFGFVSFAAGPAEASLDFQVPAGFEADPRQMSVFRQAAIICASRPQVSWIDAAKEAFFAPLASFGDPDRAAAAEFGTPAGYSVPADQLNLYRRAKQFHNMNPDISWMEAVREVA